VDEHLAAIGVADDTPIAPRELIDRIFARVFDTRIAPVLARPGAYQLAPPAHCLANAFARYLVGQLVVFTRFDFVAEAAPFARKLVSYFAEHARALTVAKVEIARGLYAA